MEKSRFSELNNLLYLESSVLMVLIGHLLSASQYYSEILKLYYPVLIVDYHIMEFSLNYDLANLAN